MFLTHLGESGNVRNINIEWDEKPTFTHKIELY